MKEDISSRKDIELLVQKFYEKVKDDDQIGFFFSDVIKVNWERHAKKMSDFWENVLFYTGDYNGDPLNAHKEFHKRRPTTPAHFERWNDLFDATLEELFSGKNTLKIREHAIAISDIMVSNIDKFTNE